MKKTFKNQPVPKTIVLVNPINNEVWYCDDFTKVKSIDGEEFITVHKPENPKRFFLIKKNALKVIKTIG